MIASLLDDEGFAVTMWPSGVGAQAMIARDCPDVVLLDLRLEESRMGTAVLDAIRDDPRTRDTAVIVSSADVHFLRKNEATLRAQGCSIIEKPFMIEALLAMIRAATPTRHTTECRVCL